MATVEQQESSRDREYRTQPVAVIDVGATSIRMAIGEIDSHGGVRTLETLTRPVNLGKDTFIDGVISKATIEECVQVFRSYRRLLEEYDITRLEQIRVVATSAVREARNRLAFLDRVYIATGLQVEPMDEAEVSRVTYLGIQPFLEAEPTLGMARTIIMEVGGGSTELLVVKNNNVVYAQTYRLGSLRLRETLEAFDAPIGKVRDIMESQIQRTVEQVGEHVRREGTVQLIALGSDIRFAASQLLSDWNPTTLARIPVEALEPFTDVILEMSEDELVRKYHLSPQEAETLGPALLAYLQSAKAFNLDDVLVTNTNLRDGLLQEMAVKNAWSEEFRNQIIRSAIGLGRRYDFDEPHARHVGLLATQLFQSLEGDHQLDSRFEAILHVAALLHEIGLFVGVRGYHKHSMYLIRNSEIFGLGRKDLMLASLAARYHRRASPQPTHEGYSMLERDDRVAVAKMAALLRLAIALDASRSQRIKEIRLTQDRNKLILGVPNVEDLSLEQLSLKQNGSLFEEIYGMQVLLRPLVSGEW